MDVAEAPCISCKPITIVLSFVLINDLRGHPECSPFKRFYVVQFAKLCQSKIHKFHGSIYIHQISLEDDTEPISLTTEQFV